MMMNKILVGDVNTILLMHFNNDMTDSSSYAKVFSPQYTDYQSGKFGNAVNLYNSVRPRCDISNVDWSNGFTIDFFVKFNTVSSGNYYGILGTFNDSVLDDSGFAIHYTSYDNIGFVLVIKGTGESIVYFASRVTADVDSLFHHFAFTYNKSDLTVFKDGIKLGTYTVGLKSINPTSLDLGRWTFSSAGANIDAIMDELRISNIVRWTADFTPPTAPYTI